MPSMTIRQHKSHFLHVLMFALYLWCHSNSHLSLGIHASGRQFCNRALAAHAKHHSVPSLNKIAHALHSALQLKPGGYMAETGDQDG